MAIGHPLDGPDRSGTLWTEVSIHLDVLHTNLGVSWTRWHALCKKTIYYVLSIFSVWRPTEFLVLSVSKHHFTKRTHFGSSTAGSHAKDHHVRPFRGTRRAVHRALYRQGASPVMAPELATSQCWHPRTSPCRTWKSNKVRSCPSENPDMSRVFSSF